MAEEGSTARGSQAARCAIGIDIGGTKIAAGLVELRTARIITKETIPTQPERGGDAVLRDTLDVARRLHAHAERIGAAVCGIGVGICELVDPVGEIRSDYLIKWHGLPARQSLAEIAPTRFESDARAPALAEARFGAGAAYRNFIYLTIGTGISYCLVLEGRPYAGAHGNAIIAGSGILSAACEQCGATVDRSLEEYASGPALVARYYQRSGDQRRGAALASGKLSSGQAVTAAAAAGDALAREVVASAGAACGNTAGFLVNALDPQALVVAGGLGLAGGLYWDSFVASTRARIWAEASRGLPVLTARLGLDAGLVGAALCAPGASAPAVGYSQPD
jgi:glucokinase